MAVVNAAAVNSVGGAGLALMYSPATFEGLPIPRDDIFPSLPCSPSSRSNSSFTSHLHFPQIWKAEAFAAPAFLRESRALYFHFFLRCWVGEAMESH